VKGEFERNAVCDRCGFEYKHYDLKKEWTGLMVCQPCWEPRNPQDFAKIPRAEKSPPWARPEPAPTYVEVTYTSAGVQESTIPSGSFNTNTL